MIKEVVIPDSHEGKAFARLTRMKWLVAAILVVALALGWLASKPVRTSDVTETIDLPRTEEGTGSSASMATTPPSTSPGSPGAATRPTQTTQAPQSSQASQSAKATPTTQAGKATRPATDGPRLTLERRVDGQITARGVVADASVRDQWLNAIRIGAQGNRVDAEIDVAAVKPVAAWDERLRQLTALTANRRLDQIHLEGDRVVLQGPAVAASYRQDTERLFRSQLPEHFHVEYRTVSPATTSRPPSAASVVDSGAGGVPSGRTDGAGAPVQRPLATAAPADTAPVRQAQASPANGTRATRPSTADCPARLDKLAANVYFRTDSEALSKAEEDRLGTLGRCMRNRRISVVGFADSRHNSQYNLELSQRRAQAVAAAIRAEAPAGASIATSAVGAEAGKSSRDARWSRRVEIRVR